MTDKPSTWGTDDKYVPVTEIKEHLIVAAPFIETGDIAFKGKTSVTLNTVDKQSEIYYSIENEFVKYENPFTISKKTSLKIYAVKDGEKSATITTDFFKIDPNVTITLKNEYANQYNGGGKNALIDGVIGAQDFRTGTWQGYSDTDLIAIVDLGKIKEINKISVGFLQDQRSWIFLPTEVAFFSSTDGINFSKLKTEYKFPPNKDENVLIKRISSSKKVKARYIKVVAKKLGILPKWHLGYKHNGRSWLFADEIQIK